MSFPLQTKRKLSSIKEPTQELQGKPYLDSLLNWNKAGEKTSRALWKWCRAASGTLVLKPAVPHWALLIHPSQVLWGQQLRTHKRQCWTITLEIGVRGHAYKLKTLEDYYMVPIIGHSLIFQENPESNVSSSGTQFQAWKGIEDWDRWVRLGPAKTTGAEEVCHQLLHQWILNHRGVGFIVWCGNIT